MNNFLLSGSQSCQSLEVSEAARGTASSQTLLWAVPSRGSTLRGGGKAPDLQVHVQIRFAW